MSTRALHGTRTVLALTVLTAMAFAGTAAAQDRPINIAVVNLDFIVANSPAGKELQGQLAAFQEQIRGEAETMTQRAGEIRQRMVEGANSLSEDKLADLQQEWEDSQIEIRRFQDDKQREGRKMQEEGLKQIETQLEPIFKKVRDEGGYDLILNNVPGVVVMVGERVDITQKVIAQLQGGGGGS